MRINIETNQKFLKLVHWIQINESQAVTKPRDLVKELIDVPVHAKYDIDDPNKLIYYLDPIQLKVWKEKDISNATKSPIMCSEGRPSISNEKVQKIKQLYSEGHSVSYITREACVGRGTVLKYIDDSF